MADERGIQQTKELLDFIFSLIGAIKESTKDGEFTWSDGLNFIEPLKKIAPAIDDIERDNSLTHEEILKNLYEIKQQLEDHQLEEERPTIEWEDLD